MPITIALINQKGGCGKSSTCFHLAGASVASGASVLLVDVAPQGSIGQGFLGSTVIENLAWEETNAVLFDQQRFRPDYDRLIRATGIEGISICPTNQHLSKFNTPTPEQLGMDQYVLKEFLETRSDFDIVLIDCPPNLYRCRWSAMLAADFVIIPVPPEDFGTQGLRAVHQAIHNARDLNPQLRRLGHLVTRFDRRLLVHRSYEARLRALYSELVFTTVIPEASAFKVALACRRPVESYSPRSRAANLTRQLVREILDRVALSNAKRQVA